MFQKGVIPTEAKRSGGILCFPAAKQHKRFLNSRCKASLIRNDAHLGIQHLCIGSKRERFPKFMASATRLTAQTRNPQAGFNPA
jgi:hypothetical protein